MTYIMYHQFSYKSKNHGKLHIIFCANFKIYYLIFFYHPMGWDVHVMYHEFDYKLLKYTLIVCTTWLTWRKKQAKSNLNLSGEQ